MKNTRPTSFDIAYLAGVSQSTVSRALRDSPHVSQETREKVQRIARELNYRVDRNATALRSQSTKTLALLIFEDETDDESHINPFFVSLLGLITRQAADSGYDLLVSFQQLDKDWHLEYEISSRADGMILLGYGDYTLYRPRLESLQAAHSHFVIWGPDLPDLPGVAVSTDNRAGGRMITEHLLDQGHKRFAFLGESTSGSPEFQQRLEGHQAALQGAGINPDNEPVFNCEYTYQAAAKVADKVIALKERPTAIVCASDLLAIGLIRGLKAAGVSVPSDISVVGYDDIAQAAAMDPPLTTIHQDTKSASKLLVEKLLAQINGEEEVKSELVQPKLIVRESTVKPAK